MNDFMMPPGGGIPGELPPGVYPFTPMPPPAQAMPVTMMPPPQEVALAPPPQPAAVPPPQAQSAQVPAPQPEAPALPPEATMSVAQEEGIKGDSPGGQGFFDKLRSDPKLSQAMLMMGLRMMQGNKPGQNAMGLVGDAMMTAATAHNMLSYNEKTDAQKAKDFALRERATNAQIASSEANTEQTRQNMKFKAELQPEELAQVRERIKQLKAAGALDEAKLLGEQVRNDPELVRRQMNDVHNQSQASAASAYAGAGSANALAADRRQELAWQRVMADPKATPEQKALAQAGLNAGRLGGGGGTISAGVQNRKDIEQRIRLANPDIKDDAKINQMVLDAEKTQKQKARGDALVDFASKMGMPAETEADWAKLEAAYERFYGGKKPPVTDRSKWEKKDGYLLRPGADRNLRSSWEKE